MNGEPEEHVLTAGHGLTAHISEIQARFLRSQQKHRLGISEVASQRLSNETTRSRCSEPAEPASMCSDHDGEFGMLVVVATHGRMAY